MKQSLNGTWRLRFARQELNSPQNPVALDNSNLTEISAEVPGNVELDLMRHGLLPDISRGNNVYQNLEYENHCWWYTRMFPAPAHKPGSSVELVFEGLDCFSTIWLNGCKIGTSDNMMISHRFDITSTINYDAPNCLDIRLDSAVIEGRKYECTPVDFAFGPNHESLSVRKAPHMYGWDIMPRIVSAGIWRDVYLEQTAPTVFTSIYWATTQVDRADNSAKLFLRWNFRTDVCSIYDLTLNISISLNGQQVYHNQEKVLGTSGLNGIELKDVELWWPRNFGSQPLYDAVLQLVDSSGNVLAENSQQIGIRTVELVASSTTSAQEDGDFCFIVNGERIFAKGTNWVPLDALHSRDKQHLNQTMAMITDCNCNMIRCWGGNVYEDHDFFELCDSNGIMVWQDFALACAIYPQDEWFQHKITIEAESVVKKLRNHPSLVLWAGNNEIDQAYRGWGCRFKEDPNLHDIISRKTLATIVRKLDPYRRYLPSSPYYSPELIEAGCRHEMIPEDHLWGPRDDFKGPFYGSSNAHFVSEIGYHGCPSRESLEEMFDPEFVWPFEHNEQWLTKAVRAVPSHTNSDYRIPLMANQARLLFADDLTNMDDFILASQISQAEADKYFIEKWRSGKPRKTGMLWWNLRDGWPIISDAVVDYYFRKKLAYYYIKASQADVCAIVTEPDNTGLHQLVVSNDTLADVHGKIKLVNIDDGAIIGKYDFTVLANSVVTVSSVPSVTAPQMWQLIIQLENGTVIKNHYLAGKRPFSLQKYRQWLEKMDLH